MSKRKLKKADESSTKREHSVDLDNEEDINLDDLNEELSSSTSSQSARDESPEPPTDPSLSLFRTDLAKMMYGCGDDSEPLESTVELMEQILIEFIFAITQEARTLSDQRGQKIFNELDLMFLIKSDPRKFQRAKDLLHFHFNLKRLRKNNAPEIERTEQMDDIDFFA